MPPKAPHSSNYHQGNLIWQFVVIAGLIIIGAAILLQNWQLNLAVSFLGMTTIPLPLSLLMGIAFASGLIVAGTISAVNSWANQRRNQRIMPPGLRNSFADDDEPSPRPPRSNYDRDSAATNPQTEVQTKVEVNYSDSPIGDRAAPVVDQFKAQNTSASDGQRISMRDAQAIPRSQPEPIRDQPLDQELNQADDREWLDDAAYLDSEDEPEDEWEDEVDGDWDDDAPDTNAPDDPETIPYGSSRSSGKSSKSKRPPLQARYIR
ncbi:MAG: LapA family protein [Pseudanabaena sp. ELA607]